MIPTAEIHDVWHCPHVLKLPHSETGGPSQSLDFWPMSSRALRHVELPGALVPCAGWGPLPHPHKCRPTSAGAVLLFLHHGGSDDVLNHSQITPEETRNLPQYSGLPQPCLAIPTPSANFEERVQHSGLNSCPSPLSSVPPLSAGISF